MFTRWLALLDSVRKARAKPGYKVPEKEKVLHDDKNHRRAKTTKH